MEEAVAPAPVRPLSLARHPIYSMLLPVPLVCFVGAVLTDVTYLNSGGNLVWLDFSTWLIFAGLVSGVVAALVLLIDFIRDPGTRNGVRWAHLVLFYAALLVELVNMFIHSRDGWTAVAGAGLVLTIVGALLMLIAGWLHRSVVDIVR